MSFRKEKREEKNYLRLKTEMKEMKRKKKYRQKHAMIQTIAMQLLHSTYQSSNEHVARIRPQAKYYTMYSDHWADCLHQMVIKLVIHLLLPVFGATNTHTHIPLCLFIFIGLNFFFLSLLDLFFHLTFAKRFCRCF